MSTDEYFDTDRAHRDWMTLVHELGHSLGLGDLYENEFNRSFGWSIMADKRTGWHLLGFEKLCLGWLELDEYHFLKRGLLDARLYEQTADKTKKKGIIYLDDNEAVAPRAASCCSRRSPRARCSASTRAPGPLIRPSACSTRSGSLGAEGPSPCRSPADHLSRG